MKNGIWTWARSFTYTYIYLHPIPREIYHKNFQEMLQGSPYIKGYIIEKDGQTAGYMILSFTYSSEVGGMVVLIEELFLHENFRGCGLGTEALDFVRKQFPHAARFRLEVTPDNGGAARLYAVRVLSHWTTVRW